ncbi:MAG: lipopolysaccharide transport periplasmic protein LptA [Deltaproteobacteria bacterium]|nr:lipopolysaccharide transport periplasmic protein LptA [Deltaproteobacteria bacterium]TLN03093.1 MAG: lipopolysaccharide transport periplasmic protein LptA [bacterium]
MKLFAGIVSGLLVVSATFCFAAAPGKDAGGQPIVIKSNELQADTKSRTATFMGKVVAKQDSITIHTDKLVVRYAEKGGNVEKVEAFGNVRIVQENRIGTAQHAVYYTNDGKIVLSGSPKVVQGKDMVSGSEITYFVNEEKSLVTGTSDARVEAVIYPKGKGRDDAAKP